MSIKNIINEDLVAISRFHGAYLVSRDGHIYSTRRGRRMLTTSYLEDGSAVVSSTLDGKPVRIRVAREVMIAFKSEPPSDIHVVVHIDGDYTNNHADNLKWVSRSDLNKLNWACATKERRAIISKVGKNNKGKYRGRKQKTEKEILQT